MPPPRKKAAPKLKPAPSLNPIADQVEADLGLDLKLIRKFDDSADQLSPLQQLLADANGSVEPDALNRCLDCGEDNLDTEACFNNKGYCLDCCHCPEHDPDYAENLRDGKGR